MKRAFALIVALAMLTGISSLGFIAGTASAAAVPRRVVNVVYDDSGSMIQIPATDELVDTWCQAKYAMEVFGAMLGSDDTMNVYVMSDYETDESKGPRLTLSGRAGIASNVAKIHNMVTYAQNTKFRSVKKAYTDLVGTTADEKWLVILTDGEFQGINNVDEYFKDKDPKVKVMFLAMGKYAGSITPNEQEGIYFEKADSNEQILTKLTEISTRIFNRDKLELKSSGKNFSFDIPMDELIVFAQGKNVSVKGIENPKGKLIKPSTKQVSVKFSEVATTNTGRYPKCIVNKELQGCVATFSGSFAEGKYKLNISNAETVEIYYNPDVEIAAYLKDSKGKEVTDLSELEAGDYTIDFGFVKGGTDKAIGKSELLGNVTYEAKVTNNGVVHESTYSAGDKISLEEGDLSIEVVGRYLDYHSVSTRLDYSIYKNKNISFEVMEGPTYTVEEDGFTEAGPIKVKMLADGKELTEKQWNNAAIPKAKLAEHHEFKIKEFIVEKSDEVGVFNVTPKLKNGKPSTGTYADCDFAIEYDELHGNESWEGKTELPIKLKDNRSWFQRNKGRIIWAIIALIILIIIIGYLPCVKGYLPKSLKDTPLIVCRPLTPGSMGAGDTTGSMQRDLITGVLPYFGQRARICFAPMGATELDVKATTKRRLQIINIESYAGDRNVKFNDAMIPAGTAKRTISANTKITVETRVMKYTCILDKE